MTNRKIIAMSRNEEAVSYYISLVMLNSLACKQVSGWLSNHYDAVSEAISGKVRETG